MSTAKQVRSATKGDLFQVKPEYSEHGLYLHPAGVARAFIVLEQANSEFGDIFWIWNLTSGKKETIAFDEILRYYHLVARTE